jgi:hypothetical protein
MAWRQVPCEYGIVCSFGRRRHSSYQRHNAQPLHEEYLTPLGSRYVRQRLRDNSSPPDWQGPLGCRFLPWWSGVKGDLHLRCTPWQTMRDATWPRAAWVLRC